jgi:K+-transporting ATPase KdpF subunit
MTLSDAIAVLIVAALFVYLLAALLKPELFS